MKLTFHRSVQKEIKEAHDWYEKKSPGLGGEFLNELDDVFEKIALNPDRYAVEFHNIRAGLLKRFPYVVYYRNKIDHIRLLAVFHASRNPDRWQSRN